MKTEKKPSRFITAENGAQAVNFREIGVSKIAPNTLYRSSHPIKDLKQEKVISILAANAKIAAILNLCDTNSGIAMKLAKAAARSRQ